MIFSVQLLSRLLLSFYLRKSDSSPTFVKHSSRLTREQGKKSIYVIIFQEEIWTTFSTEKP